MDAAALRLCSDAAGVLAAFLALPAEQQAIFDYRVYFDELRISGREYNDPSSRRFQSYARGREAIATLFPYQVGTGDITLLSSNAAPYGKRASACRAPSTSPR